MSITEISIKRPSLIVVIFTILSVLGVISYSKLNYELLPKFSSPFVTISTIYPGASPQEVESSVSKKIEDAISSIENIKTIRTISQENVSIVMVELLPSADAEYGLREAQRKINEVINQLPENIKTPSVQKFALDEMPIIRLGVNSNLKPTEFFDLVKNKINPVLASIEGVAQVSITGGEEREIKVNVNPDKLQLYGVSIGQVAQAINLSNIDFPTGKVKNDENQILVRLAGKFDNIESLKDVVVKTTPDGSAIKVRDIAEVLDTRKDFSTISRINKEASIGLQIKKQTDANAVSVSQKVLMQIKLIEANYVNEGLTFDVAQNSSDYTMNAADAVVFDLVLAVFLVAFVMLIFLHSLRNSIIVMIAIPASMVTTFIAMYLLNFSLNLMTLLALSLVVGILVDDSIVVLENIYRHLAMGKDKKQASLDGRNEIGFTALGITMVDVVVFFPLILLDGLIANILRQFSVVVIVSTLMSLFVSFTVTPLLASRFSKIEELNPNSIMGKLGIYFEELMTNLNNAYGRTIIWALKHKFLVLAVTFLTFVFSIYLVGAGFIEGEFVAKGDQGQFVIQLELDKKVSLEQNNYTTLKAEEELLKLPEIQKVITSVGGSSSIMAGQSAQYKSELIVVLVDKKKRTKTTNEMILEARKVVEKVPGVDPTVTNIAIFGGADEAPIQVVVKGANLKDVMKDAKTLKNIIATIPGTQYIKLSVEDGNPEIKIVPDKEKMSQLGLSIAQVGQTIQTALTGNDNSKYRDKDNEYDIRIKFDDFDKNNVEDISHIEFVNNYGQIVKLSQFATIEQTTGPSQLERRNRIPSVMIRAHLDGRKSGTVGNEIKVLYDKIKLSPGVTWEFDGDLANQADAFGSLFLALGTSILFVYLIMVALYDSYIYPFVVLFSIPVAIVGALLALALTMNTLSVFTMLGVIMLIGLVGKNAILLVDFTNQLKAEHHMGTVEALIEAGKERLRPILMTTIAMVIGFLPIAMSKAAGAEWKNGLAWALVGGLTSSMFLTLLVVPVVYNIVDNIKARVMKLLGRDQNIDIKEDKLNDKKLEVSH